jgi:hypothetical protein
VDAHAQASRGKAHGRRAAGDAAADDRDVDAALVPAVLAWWDGIFEPVRIQDVER